jgi:putative photosynthetic complex assembly protein
MSGAAVPAAASGRAAGTPKAPDSFPRWVLLCAGGLIVFSLASVALIRATGNGPGFVPADHTVQRPLRFEDRPDGSIVVVDANTGQTIARLQGEQGFVRGALRALARERRSRDLGPEVPFKLIAQSDGRLTLLDPATGQRVDLESFGPTNSGEFARLLSLNAPAAAAR